jgi:hypothetical protein
MKRVTKTLSIKDWIVDAVATLAEKERRSFTGEVEVLLAEALRSLEAEGKGNSGSTD